MDGVEIGNLQIPAIKGEKGDAGKIVGLTITMLESTATPSVTNIGTEYEANYILGIPRGTGIASVVKNDDGELVITLTDGTIINLGSIEAVSITNVEIDESFNLVVTLSNGDEIVAGNLDEELAEIIESHLENYYTKTDANATFTSKTEMANALMGLNLNGYELNYTRYNGSIVRISLEGLFSAYQELITASNKLNADYVDDTNSTNKFATTAEKTTWNNKANTSDIPTKTSNLTNDSGFITNTNYASSSTGGVIKTGGGTSLSDNKTLIASQYTGQQIWVGGSGAPETNTLASIGSVKQAILYKIKDSVSSSSTNKETIGAKLFYDTIGNLETILETLDTGSGV